MLARSTVSLEYCILVHFLLLWQNTCDWVIYKTKKSMWVLVLESGKSKGMLLASAWFLVKKSGCFSSWWQVEAYMRQNKGQP